jgi:hypothetical protein
MIKKAHYILFTVAFMTGCSSFTANQLTAQVYEAVIGFKYQAISRNQFEETKYSFAIAQVGKTTPVKLILASIDNNIYKWVSADKITIYTKNGIIIKTNGLINDFFSVPITDNPTSMMPSVHSITFHFPELTHLQRKDSFTLIETGAEYEYLSGEYIMVDVFNYSTEIPLIKWSETNKLLKKSDTGEVIAIEQKFHPHHPILKLYYYLK